MTQNTTGVVFYPRLYHLMAYICILMGDGQNCSLFLNTALSFSETQGNMLEKCWLNMSKVGTIAGDPGWGARLLREPRWVFPGAEAHHGPFWNRMERRDTPRVQLGPPPPPAFSWGLPFLPTPQQGRRPRPVALATLQLVLPPPPEAKATLRTEHSTFYSRSVE